MMTTPHLSIMDILAERLLEPDGTIEKAGAERKRRFALGFD